MFGTASLPTYVKCLTKSYTKDVTVRERNTFRKKERERERKEFQKMEAKKKWLKSRHVDCLSITLKMRMTTAMLPPLKEKTSDSYESKLFEGVLNGFILGEEDRRKTTLAAQPDTTNVKEHYKGTLF